jgi:hypothetical protein
MRNVAQLGRRELEAHRDIVVGVTSSVPAYKIVDDAGHKEWVVDVYIGPLEDVEKAIVRDVPIAAYAKELVGDIRQPVQLFRSKQGKYTVTGRAKILTAGAQMPDGSITEPTFRSVSYNLAELELEYVADLDYSLETLGGFGAVLQATEDTPLQTIRGYDAFGNQVIGPELPEVAPRFSIEPVVVVRTRHTVLTMSTLGPPGDPGAMRWGVGPLQEALPRIVELIS